MVQFNLLPDIKQQYIKSIKQKRLINFVSLIVGCGFLMIFILMFLFVRVQQKNHISSLTKEITTGVNQLKSNEDLDKILTIQNQLSSLPTLHANKVMTSRLFEYLGQLVPNDANVFDVNLDVATNTIDLKGTAKDVQTVNKFVDTIKFTEYTLDGKQTSSPRAFSEVVLQSINVAQNQTGSNNNVSYQITFKYASDIFKNTATDGEPLANNVKLTVPKIVTTRSETQKPSDLFMSKPADQSTGGTQ